MMIQIPDNTKYVGKTYILLKGAKIGDYKYPKDIKFKITSIKGNWVTVKMVSNMEECEDIIKKHNDYIVSNMNKDIKVFDKIISIWEKDYDNFIPLSNKEHGINTGYKIPNNKNSDYFLTLDYYNSNGIKNLYSYQRGTNVWYSLDCYKYMRLGVLEQLEESKKFTLRDKKQIFKSLQEKVEFKIDKLNLLQFVEYNITYKRKLKLDKLDEING